MDANPRFPAALSTPAHAGRPCQWQEIVACRFPARTSHRARQVLQPGETVASFIRLAVGREIERRQEEAARQTRLDAVRALIA